MSALIRGGWFMNDARYGFLSRLSSTAKSSVRTLSPGPGIGLRLVLSYEAPPPPAPPFEFVTGGYS